VRVAVYHSNDDIRIEERPEPVAGPGEAVLRVMASGICGSDVMEWYRRPRAPRVLGHEIAGVVEQLGSGVVGFERGDRVVATHHVPCNRCRACLAGRHAVCEMLQATAFDPGGFCESVRLSRDHVERGMLRLPDGVTFEEGSFVEPLGCAVRGQRLAGVGPGDAVAVLGSGISGILHIQLARALGARRVLATDPSPFRLEAARRFGADAAFPADAEAVGRLRAANEGCGVERVLVCAAARQAMLQALELVEAGGTVLLFAPLPPGESLPLPVGELWRRNVALVHSYAGPPADMLTALDLIAGRRVDVAAMVTHRVGLARAAEGFRITASGGESLKVIVEPQRDAGKGRP
jgi:L-iditol 2-dehydrogenase